MGKSAKAPWVSGHGSRHAFVEHVVNHSVHEGFRGSNTGWKLFSKAREGSSSSTGATVPLYIRTQNQVAPVLVTARYLKEKGCVCAAAEDTLIQDLI